MVIHEGLVELAGTGDFDGCRYRSGHLLYGFGSRLSAAPTAASTSAAIGGSSLRRVLCRHRNRQLTPSGYPAESREKNSRYDLSWQVMHGDFSDYTTIGSANLVDKFGRRDRPSEERLHVLQRRLVHGLLAAHRRVVNQDRPVVQEERIAQG